MSYIGFTLGLLGSLHCMLMCGPLVVGVSRTANLSGVRLLSHSVVYNTGRISAYVLLGIIFSLIGGAFAIVGLQKILSIATGVFLLLLVLASLDLEKFIFKFEMTRSFYKNYLNFVSSRIKVMAANNPVALGFLNGLLPCGMVYVALAGALGAKSVVSGSLFMLSFGIGTLPMMIAIMIGAKWLSKLKALNLKLVVPIGQTALGLYLIFRGMATDLPLDFNI